MINKRALLLVLITLANILGTGAVSNPAPVTIAYVTGGALEDERQFFVRAFKDAYKDIPLDVLKVDNLEAFLLTSFDDAVMHFNKMDKKVHCAVARSEGMPVGIIMFEPTGSDGAVYIELLAVDPSVQKRGIGQQLIAVIQTTLPSTNKIILATRRVNSVACNFYKKIGFKQCEQLPHGLDLECYIGFEKEMGRREQVTQES